MMISCSTSSNNCLIKSDSGKISRGHRTSKTAKSRQSYSNGHLAYHYSFHYLARALVYDVAYEFVCAATMLRNNWRERP